MLKKPFRATSKDLASMRGARSVRTKHLLISYKKNPNGKAVFSCSVAKKVAKRAVDRNLLKRQCRHALEEMRPALFPPHTVQVRIIDATVIHDDFLAELKEFFDTVMK